jgi:hypothetical protein
VLVGGEEDLGLGAHTVGPDARRDTVYGMNFNHMPELHWLLGYPLALLLVLVPSVSLHALRRPL